MSMDVVLCDTQLMIDKPENGKKQEDKNPKEKRKEKTGKERAKRKLGETIKISITIVNLVLLVIQPIQFPGRIIFIFFLEFVNLSRF